MKILSIETSADETCAAVTDGRKVLANVIYSQILTHAKWGGIYPVLAKRAHLKKIDKVITRALKKIKINQIDYIAVTYGPGLAIALEVGLKKAKELALKYHKKLIAVNHLEGHIYSSFVQNSHGHPERKFEFPLLALIISGGHTEFVLLKDHINYQVIGETLDDASGEALDKAAKMLGLGYPGGPVIERLALQVKNQDFFKFPRPMLKSDNLNFSFSGLKTSFYYYIDKLKQPEKTAKLKELASSFQEAVFDTLSKKTERAIKQTNINRLVVGGGVSANLYLRRLLSNLVKKYQGKIYFPPYRYLTGDNAAMIGVAAYYRAKKGLFTDKKKFDKLDRIPRLRL